MVGYCVKTDNTHKLNKSGKFDNMYPIHSVTNINDSDNLESNNSKKFKISHAIEIYDYFHDEIPYKYILGLNILINMQMLLKFSIWV